jgi:hypothetical protein
VVLLGSQDRANAMQLRAEDRSREPRCVRPPEKDKRWFKMRKTGGGEARVVVSGVTEVPALRKENIGFRACNAL